MAFDVHKGDLERAWAIGLFEGEGCILIGTLRGARRVVLTLGMTDYDVVERFVAVVGVGRIISRPGRKPEHRPFHTWSISGRKCGPVLELLMDGFGKRRRAKAEDALAALAQTKTANRDKTHCPLGHPYDDANTWRYRGFRRCRACWTVR